MKHALLAQFAVLSLCAQGAMCQEYFATSHDLRLAVDLDQIKQLLGNFKGAFYGDTIAWESLAVEIHIAAVPLLNRDNAAARTRRCATACALTEILNRAQARGMLHLNARAFRYA
jgi:hypothetical protein